MSNNRTYQPVPDTIAWKGAALADSASWLTQVTPENIRDMEAALAGVRARGLGMEAITQADFPLPSPRRAARRHRARHRGRARLRVAARLAGRRWGVEDATAIYWGFSTHLGTPTSQNRRGDRMVAVRDAGLSAAELNVRGPQTNARLYYHSDFADIVGLLCIHPSMSGGVSRICSSMAIYNALLAAGRHDLLDAVYDGYPFDRKGEEGPGVAPVSEAPIPMLSWFRDRLSFRYVPGWSETATKRTGQPWTAVQKAAIDEVNRLSNLPEFYLDMNFQVGDVQFLNNYAVLHSRTDFVDFPEPERKRFLQRIWLRATLGRELAPEFDHLFGPASTRDGIPAVTDRLTAALEAGRHGVRCGDPRLCRPRGTQQEPDHRVQLVQHHRLAHLGAAAAVARRLQKGGDGRLHHHLRHHHPGRQQRRVERHRVVRAHAERGSVDHQVGAVGVGHGRGGGVVARIAQALCQRRGTVRGHIK